MIVLRGVLTQKPVSYCIRTVVFVCISLLLSTGTASASRTVFLPLKVEQGAEQYTNEIDQLFAARLSGTDIKFIGRSGAERLVNYSGTWPPSLSQIEKIARNTVADTVIVGAMEKGANGFTLDLQYIDPAQKTKNFHQTASSLRGLVDSVEELVSAVEQYSDQGIHVASIDVAGNKRIDSGAILRQIETQQGSKYEENILREDLKKIFAMGWFDDVQLDVEESGDGKNVIFRVVEKPLITTVDYNGIAEVDEEEVRAAANIREQHILNTLQLNTAKKAIKNFYIGKGFYNSQVDADVVETNDGATVTFSINEGKKIYIKEIRIDGNKAFSDDDILDEIKTGEHWFMSWLTDSGVLDKSKISQDTKRIAAFYADNGYLDIKVSDPVTVQEEEWLYVVFNVDEGTRYRVGTIDIAGIGLDDGEREELLKLLDIRNKSYVSRKVVQRDIMKLTDFFAEKGYAFALITPRFSRSGSDRMDIVFDISKDRQVRIGRIEIRGNSRTHDNVIRRELKIVEGGIFDSKAMRESVRALQRLQFFESVEITPESMPDDDERTKIIIDVKEKSTGSFSIGAGYSSTDKLIFMGQIAENNFMGRGDTVAFSANLGSSSSRFNLAYTNPHLNDSELSWGFDVFHSEREYDDYTRESTGGGLRVGYPLWEKWRIYGNYTLVDTDLSDVAETASYIIRNSVDIHLTSAIKVSLVRDTRNLRFGATEGSRNALSVKYAGGPLGGDAQFTKLEASSGWYFPFLWDTAFHVKGAVGQVFENETDKLPVYERFYIGGLSSVRGFKYAKISPIDVETDDRVGGDQMWYTNLEYIFPLIADQGMRGLVFFDAGQSLDTEYDFGAGDDVKTAVGAGINWLSPLGPLQLVLGCNLDPSKDEDDTVFDFSIGGTF